MVKKLSGLCLIGLAILLLSSAALADLPTVTLPDFFPPPVGLPQPYNTAPYQQQDNTVYQQQQINTVNAASEGQLTGIVVDNKGRPLGGAEVFLDCGLRTYSALDGSFTFPSVPVGTQIVHIQKNGYKLAKGSVSIVPGSSRSLKVSLSKLSEASGAKNGKGSEQAAPLRRGTFEVSGQAMRVGPRERRAWVYKIEVTDLTDSKTWENTWWDDVGQSYYTLTCDDAIIGHRFRIKITWRNHGRYKKEYSNDWDVEFTRNGQTFTYDHPMN
ncbi:carboxypeptidase regulatory-like domain-containing protein [bacterium]|nr:carboxypeptidase regulatory-like domain-containing protein [bacterium]